jgi:hypothetical protein
MQFHEIDLEAFELGLRDKNKSERKEVKVCGTGINANFERCALLAWVGTSSLKMNGMSGCLHEGSFNMTCLVGRSCWV